jgi:hypothetical protein
MSDELERICNESDLIEALSMKCPGCPDRIIGVLAEVRT